MSESNKLKVEVWSDVVCPFCYIGQRHLEEALAQVDLSKDIDIEWKSYQLDPTFKQDPEVKYDLIASLSKKLNRSMHEIEELQKQIVDRAYAVGLNFDFENAIFFNTFYAHCVIQKAKEMGLGNNAEKKFFSDYFEQGKDLGNLDVLREEATRIGLSQDDFKDAISNKKYTDLVLNDIKEANSIGVRGVPFFLVDGKYAISGAQPINIFVDTLNNAHKEWTEKQKANIEIVASGSSCDINGNCQ